MFELAFNSFVTLVVVVDPLGLAPIFAALTHGYSKQRKKEAAIRGTIVGAAILFLFALVGDSLLGALGIGLPAFRIAGGALLFLLSLDMIFARSSGMRSRTIREQEEDSYEDDISVFPLAIPLLAGPGAITGVLLYTGGRETMEVITVLVVLTAILLLTLLSLLLAPRIMGFFGDSGTNVLARVLGVLLAALAVQFILDGIKASLGS